MEGYRIIKGKEPGPVVCIIASLHGEEPAGMAAYAFLKKCFIDEGNELKFGEIRLIKGNIEARKAGIRYFEYDLNRMFMEDYHDSVDTDCYEYKRAQEIKKMVEGADYVLDLHSMTSEGEPFTIMADADKDYPEHMLNLPVSFTSSGWGNALEGTLMDWVIPRGSEYIAVESGLNGSKEADDTARNVAIALLNQLGMTDFPLEFERPKRHLKLMKREAIRDHDSYRYPTKTYASFDPLAPNELIAVDTKGEYRAPDMENLVIIMPASQESVRNRHNNDAFFLGQFSAF